MTELPLTTIKRIIRKQGLRAGVDASIELTNILEDNAYTIAERAHKLAKHAGRKTVIREDIILAVEELTKD